MAAVLGIFCGRNLSIHMHHENYPNKSKLVLFILLKALRVCTEKQQQEGACQVINTAQGKAECCFYLETRPRVLYFSYTQAQAVL